MELSNKKILITGASGFVGKALVNSLSKTNNELFLITRREVNIPKTNIFKGDLSNTDFCKKSLKDIDLVYYLAGYKENLSSHLERPYDFVYNNVSPLLSFLNALKGSKVKSLIYLSSTIVDYVNLDEEVTDGYVLGKYINELLLKSFAKEHNFDIKIIRSAAIYGPGDNFNPNKANLIPALIDRISSSEQELIIWGKGKREMQFIYLDDLIANLIESVNKKDNLFSVGNQEIVTVNELAQLITKAMNKELKFKHDLNKPDKESKLNKFSNLVKPQVNIQEGIKNTINYYNKINV